MAKKRAVKLKPRPPKAPKPLKTADRLLRLEAQVAGLESLLAQLVTHCCWPVLRSPLPSVTQPLWSVPEVSPLQAPGKPGPVHAY